MASPPIPIPTPQPSMSPAELDIFFRKFNDYPWLRDRPFLQALLPTVGPQTATPFTRPTALSLTLQARIWWFSTRFATTIDRTLYETWSTTHPSQVDAQLLDKITQIQKQLVRAEEEESQLPAWMVSAPKKVDLGVKADDGDVRDSDGNGNGNEKAPYPAHFQAIIEAVTTGKPVEGVREIPNTVVRKEGITAVGKMQAPRKPWERQRSEIGGLVEREFPPVGEETTAGP
ncbi:hypothetical protein OQA88_12263 [Cercophora sp. LCS_1]